MALASLASCPVRIGPCAGGLIGWDHDRASGELVSEYTRMGPLRLVLVPAADGQGSQVRVALGSAGGVGGGSSAGQQQEQSFDLGGGEISTHDGEQLLCLRNGTDAARNDVSVGSCQLPQAKEWVAFKL
jgi:hypothetical protein